MSNGGIAQTPNWSAQHVKVPRVGPLQVKSATGDDVLAAKAFNTLVVGAVIAPATALVIGVTGRNLILVVTDANNSETWQFEVQGVNQFGEVITELFPHAGPSAVAATVVGTKIFTKITGIICRSLAGDKAAADSVKIGTGDKVGMPTMCRPDLSDILDLELSVANQATAPTKKAVSAANIDATNFAFLEAMFAGSVVVAGDNVAYRQRTQYDNPDDVRLFPNKANAA